MNILKLISNLGPVINHLAFEDIGIVQQHSTAPRFSRDQDDWSQNGWQMFGWEGSFDFATAGSCRILSSRYQGLKQLECEADCSLSYIATACKSL
jgi:hypothetical protein